MSRSLHAHYIWIIHVIFDTVNNVIPVLRLGSSCSWQNPPICPLLYLKSQTCLFTYSNALPHSRQIISERWLLLLLLSPAASFKGLYPLALATGRREGRGTEVGVVTAFSRQAQQSSGGSQCPTVNCRVCCCFAEGLWEVLALGGQMRTPPSSCFDRHPVLTQTFSLFHFICGLSYGPFPRSYKLGWLYVTAVSSQISLLFLDLFI